MATSKTSEIILGRVEYINASHFNCLSFAKASDMVNGINVRLSNMAGGYPFSFGGVTWHDSETLYLCGEFSDSLGKIPFFDENLHHYEDKLWTLQSLDLLSSPTIPNPQSPIPNPQSPIPNPQ